MIHLQDGSIVPDKSELPIKLPSDINLDKSGNPLEHHKTWKIIHKKLESQLLEKQTLLIHLWIRHGIS